MPHALLHNLKHNKVLHERIMILTVSIDEVPYVVDGGPHRRGGSGPGFYRMIVRYGFMQELDVPAVLKTIENCGPKFKMMETSFFLSRQTLLAIGPAGHGDLAREAVRWMLRNAESAMEFFRLPTNRVVELGSQVEI